MIKGWYRGVVLAACCSVAAVPGLAAETGDGPAEKKPRVELSVRSWMFTNGETKWAHNASGLSSLLGNPTSKLTYTDTSTHIMELAARLHLSRRLYLEGDLGFSVKFDHGRLVDDDYVAVGGQRLFSRTHSDLSGSGTQYVNLNMGYRAVEFAGNRGYLDVVGGFQYWRTEYEATGVRQIVCNPSGIPDLTCAPPGSSLPGVLAITNTTHWITPIRAGLETEYRVSRRVSAVFKAFFSPVSVVYNEDVHHLRSDLQQNPSFSMWGVGMSADGDVSIKIMLTRSLALTGGYRVWWNRVYDGTWENHPVGASSDTAPLTEFQTIRHGPTIGLTALF